MARTGDYKKQQSVLLSYQAINYHTNFTAKLVTVLALGSLCNDDGDVNENGKRSNRSRSAKQQLCTSNTLFLYIPLPSLHDYDVKMHNFTFYGGREQKTTIFFFFS